MRNHLPGLKFAWYGDDFTGAADTLATAEQAGLRSMLFLGLPTETQLACCGPLDCLGIAGAARSMTPTQIKAELLPVGQLFAELGAPVVHYKICSTFDSAPISGSIGAAIEVLRSTVSNAFVPIVGGQPSLGRYCVFGNLFARTGSNGAFHRLDRHPTMSNHPVTPMHEADLRLHLAGQGLMRLASLDYPMYDESPPTVENKLDDLLSENPQAILMDVAHSSNLAVIGKLIWRRAQQHRLLAVGASSVVQALVAHWDSRSDICSKPDEPKIVPASGPVLVLAGSLSPHTARQIQCATSYARVLLDPKEISSPDDTYCHKVASHVAALLRQGQSVLACTSDASRSPTKDGSQDSRTLAIACGAWLAQVLRAAPVRRLGIAGGDTSSYAVRALDAWGLSYLQSLSPGVALCRLHSDRAHLDGLEISLKGGQMGSDDLFERLLHGT